MSGGSSAAEAVRFWTAPALNDLPWLSHGITGREGGVSSGDYESLNMALHVGDDPVAVLENRRRAGMSLGFPLDAMVCAEQVHGNVVQIVGSLDRGKGATDLATVIPGVDALVTNTPGVLLALFYADCLPILFSDSEQRVVAVAHAGWRGLGGGVIEKTIAVMHDSFGTEPANIRVGVGPGIASCCFEVGVEVAALFPPDLVLPPLTSGVNPRVDLIGDAQRRLRTAGVSGENVSVCAECTACFHGDTKNPDDTYRWFSHRRTAGKAGRMGALIGIC